MKETTILAGDLINEMCEGANLVEGRQPWELSAEARRDLEKMKKCCDAEIAMMRKTGLVAAPFYFEAVAILLRRAKEYEEEIRYCETYIDLAEKFYSGKDLSQLADVRKGPRYQAILARLPKAKELSQKEISGKK